jgi:hypothetical protein
VTGRTNGAVTPETGSWANVEVRKTGIGRVIRFESDELLILPKARRHADTPNRISAGTFHPDEDGRSHVTFAAAVDPAKYPVLSVTAEPRDGDPEPTRPEVLRSSEPTDVRRSDPATCCPPSARERLALAGLPPPVSADMLAAIDRGGPKGC